MPQVAKAKEEMDFDPVWLRFTQDSLESRYRQRAVHENVKPLSWLYIVSGLLAALPALYIALSISSQTLIYFALCIGLMPVIAGFSQSYSIIKDVKHKQNNKVSMLFVVLLNMTSALLGLIVSMFDMSMAWAPLGPVIFCFGLALWLPSVKGVSTVILITALLNTFAIFVGGYFLHQGLGIELTLWGWFLLCLFPLIPFSRQRNIDRRRLYLIASQLKMSENTLDNESFERRRLWRVLRQSVQTDPVTHLFEHKYFFKLCQLELERAVRYKRAMSLMIVSIENFAKLEKQYGEECLAGIEMAVASMLRQQVRQQDIIGRMAGNDFGVLLPETDINEAKIAAQRIHMANIEQEIASCETPVKINIKCGLASLSLADPNSAEHNNDPETEMDNLFKLAVSNLS